jgi:3-dehydro-L-gulonate 2-dehydrogenase
MEPTRVVPKAAHSSAYTKLASADEQRVPFETMKDTCGEILRSHGFSAERASLLATIFSSSSRDGVQSHGMNRFPKFCADVRSGVIDKDASPSLNQSLGALEQWDGNRGAGPLNAMACTQTALELANKFGIGCVALRNTNHWMRGGTYGWHAADQGFGLISWTNTTPLMPPHGTATPRLGNNPFVMAVPRANADGAHVVLDMAMTQVGHTRHIAHPIRHTYCMDNSRISMLFE